MSLRDFMIHKGMYKGEEEEKETFLATSDMRKGQSSFVIFKSATPYYLPKAWRVEGNYPYFFLSP